MSNPQPEYLEIYEVDYPGLQLAFLSDKEVMFNITSSHPLFNAFSHQSYNEDARVLAVLDIQSGKLSGVYGRMSPVHLSWRFLPYLSSVKLGGGNENGFFYSPYSKHCRHSSYKSVFFMIKNFEIDKIPLDKITYRNLII